MYFHTYAQAFSTLSAVLICGYAFWVGGKPERFVGALIFLAWMATPVFQHFADRQHFEITVFAIDGVLTLALVGLAFTTNRFWPLLATGFQILEVLMHIAILIDRRVHPRAYFVGMEIWSYLVLVTLAIGTRLEAPRLQRATQRASPLGNA